MSGITVKQLVDPLLVTTLLVDRRFIRLVNAVKQGDQHGTKYWAEVLTQQGFTEPVLIAALEKIDDEAH